MIYRTCSSNAFRILRQSSPSWVVMSSFWLNRMALKDSLFEIFFGSFSVVKKVYFFISEFTSCSRYAFAFTGDEVVALITNVFTAQGVVSLCWIFVFRNLSALILILVIICLGFGFPRLRYCSNLRRSLGLV